MRLSILLVILSINIISAQRSGLVKGDIYALIIGVSDYAENGPTDLNFAHKDAEIFAEYLMSDAGGNALQANIKLLTNEDATIANVYNAKSEIENMAEKNDLVYLYFSGHGDVEDGVHKRGYLLLHDSPTQNYENNALRIEDLNATANTLSVNKDVEVVIITDACHSGKLSGSDNARARTLGDRLVKVENNEVRIASCESTQESQENPAWGGGRGAFSFHMINGLKGLADDDNDKKITLSELKSYLDKTVPKDVEKVTEKFQDPVVEGKSRKKMAIVDQATLENIISSSSDMEMATLGGARAIAFVKTAQDIYFSKLNSENIKNALDFRMLAELSSDEVVNIIINQFRFDQEPDSNESSWVDDLNSDVLLRNTFKPGLAAAIHNEVQKTINAYLRGDKDEMERRRYYNAQTSDFDEYAYMLETAAKLLPPNSSLHHIIQVKKHYFAGVAARLNIANMSNKDSLISIAMSEQEKALNLDDKAAYIHNEIGILYGLKDQDEKALQKFKLASEIEKNWAVPIGNMGNTYYRLQKYKDGLAMAQRAIELQPDFVNAHVAVGKNALALNNYLLAEEVFIIASKLNDKNYRCLEGLGEVYLKTMRYYDANYYYDLADKVKAGLQALMMRPILGLTDQDADGIIDLIDSELDSPGDPCILDTTLFGAKDIFANFEYAQRNYSSGNFEVAKIFFKKVLLIQNDDPLAPHYLAQIYYKQEKFIAAQYYFTLAMDSFRDGDNFNEYLDLITPDQSFIDCFVRYNYINHQYDQSLNYYILADVSVKLNDFSKAEVLYRYQINANVISESVEIIPYYLLWNLYSERKFYSEAEHIIRSYTDQNPDQGNLELYNFYSELAFGDYKPNHYAYQAGLVCYNIMKNAEPPEILEEYNSFKTGLIDEGRHYFISDPAILILGTNQTISLATSEISPIKSGVEFMLRGLSSDQDSILIASKYNMLGEFTEFLGDTNGAFDYYVTASSYNDDNASMSYKLVDMLTNRDKFSEAYAILNDLDRLNRINYKFLVQKSKYDVLSGEYVMGENNSNRILLINPIESAINKAIMGMRYMLDGKLESAIPYFEWLYNNDENKDFHAYTLCRIYSQISQLDKAQEYLQIADGLEFNFKQILKYDPFMAHLSVTDGYKTIASRYMDIIRQ